MQQECKPGEKGGLRENSYIFNLNSWWDVVQRRSLSGGVARMNHKAVRGMRKRFSLIFLPLTPLIVMAYGSSVANTLYPHMGNITSYAGYSNFYFKVTHLSMARPWLDTSEAI